MKTIIKKLILLMLFSSSYLHASERVRDGFFMNTEVGWSNVFIAHKQFEDSVYPDYALDDFEYSSGTVFDIGFGYYINPQFSMLYHIPVTTTVCNEFCKKSHFFAQIEISGEYYFTPLSTTPFIQVGLSRYQNSFIKGFEVSLDSEYPMQPNKFYDDGHAYGIKTEGVMVSTAIGYLIDNRFYYKVNYTLGFGEDINGRYQNGFSSSLNFTIGLQYF